MKARVPNVDPANFAAGYGYMVAQALVVSWSSARTI